MPNCFVGGSCLCSSEYGNAGNPLLNPKSNAACLCLINEQNLLQKGAPFYNVFLGSWPPERAITVDRCSGGKFVVPRAVEAYDARVRGSNGKFRIIGWTWYVSSRERLTCSRMM